MNRCTTDARLISKLSGSPSVKDLLDLLSTETTKAKTVTFVNSYSYQVLRTRPDSSSIDFVYPDGILMAKLLSWLTGIQVARVSFDSTSLAPGVFDVSERHGLKCALVGSSSDAANQTAKRIREKFPRLKIVYVRGGFFGSDDEIENAYENMNVLGAQVLVCGMGTPLQEAFVLGAARKVETLRMAFTCGGFIHQCQKDFTYFSPMWDKYHLRWLFRLIKEPHTRGRFFRAYPMLPFVLVYDLLSKGSNSAG
jgi:UDP-Gal:alpha-D-GlcNAc-diphosphoundecaprenol beta-1,4-galactosyltransferase